MRHVGVGARRRTGRVAELRETAIAWAAVIPLATTFGEPEPAPFSPEGAEPPLW